MQRLPCGVVVKARAVGLYDQVLFDIIVVNGIYVLSS